MLTIRANGMPAIPKRDGSMNVNDRTRMHRSTAEVHGPDAFGYWSDTVCEAFVGVSVRPEIKESFQGRIEHVAMDGVGFASVAADAQQVARTSRLVARDHDEFCLVNVQLGGQARLQQDGRLCSPRET